MARPGFGLRSIIGLQLFIVLMLLGAMLAYAAYRLGRHGLVMDAVHWSRAVMQELAHELERDCRGLAQPCAKGGAEVARALRDLSAPGRVPFLLSLTLADTNGNPLSSSDPRLQARARWDAFAAAAPPSAGQGWNLIEDGALRMLCQRVPLADAGLQLHGVFSLEQADNLAGRLLRNVSLYAALLIVALATIGWIMFFRVVVRPLERLLASADRISAGELSGLLVAERGSAMGRLGFALSQAVNRIEQDKLTLRAQIEQLRRLNHELHQAQQGLIRSEKLASVGRLAAGLAHEIGNPMSAILGYVGMLRKERIPEPDQQDILQRVEHEVERIDRVIRDLLAYSRPGKGVVQPARAHDLVENAMLLIRPQKKFKQVRFTIEVPQDLPPVAADADLARQVLVNLLLNALEAVPDNGHIWVRAVAVEMTAASEAAPFGASEAAPFGASEAAPFGASEAAPFGAREAAPCVLARTHGERRLRWIGCEGDPLFFQDGPQHRLRLPRDGRDLASGARQVVFSVVDDGAGIASQVLPRIFDPFFTTKEPGRGTGLGLAICHSAVASMAGEIWAWSEPGQGAQLAFTLPVAIPA